MLYCTHRSTILMLYSQCLLQLSSEKLPLAGDGNRNRNLQLNNMRRMKDLRSLSPTWDVSIKSHPSGLQALCRRGEKIVRAIGDRKQGKMSFKHTWTDAHMNSKYCGCMHRSLFLAYWGPRVERKNKQDLISNPKDLLD